MKKSRPSIDGFVPRRPQAQLGELHATKSGHRPSRDGQSARIVHSGSEAEVTNRRAPKLGVVRNEINESLRSIDAEMPANGTKGRRQKGSKKPLTTRRRVIKWVIIALITLLVVMGVYFGYKLLSSGSKIFRGNILDAITQNQPLKEDGNGRTNILVFGTEGSAENSDHPGADLTDSIMVLSINQKTKDAYMISLPRDLYVKHDPVCPTLGTNAGKLNETYSCGAGVAKNEEAGAQELRETAGSILGLDVQYHVHLNWAVVVGVVDAIGGIDVTIESSDPRGILDRNYDGNCQYTCYYVNYKNGETVHMDGDHALALARARNANGGYGLAGGNFDREKNQQKIILAIREKAVSVGTFTDLNAMTGLMDALGENLHTNFEAKEIKTLMSLGNSIKSDQIKSISLVDEENALVTTDNVSGQSIVRPLAGLFDYSAIYSHVREQLSSDPVTKEKAGVDVLNGSETAGVAQRQADKLNEQGFIINDVGNAPDGQYDNVTIYQIGTGNPATAAKLKEVYGVEVQATAPPFQVIGDAKFVVVFGADPDAVSQ
jgi:LCP family protein required for cell wall assembly